MLDIKKTLYKIVLKKKFKNLLVYLFLILFGVIMSFPLLWLVSSSLKPDYKEIFGSLSLIPSKIDFGSYVRGWKGIGELSFARFFFNSFVLVIPTTIFTLISSILVGYGFARFKFAFKKTLFLIMISTIMMPATVLIVPRYILFKNLGWLDTYLPFYMPALFGTYPFFTFMFIQFFRGIPREIDESAVIDGCNSFKILTNILLPLSKPVIFAAMVFQFIWTWNDFLTQLIYINSTTKFTISLGLRMTIDFDSLPNWNEIMAMAVLAMIPPVLLFFFTQKYFVEGMMKGSLK